MGQCKAARWRELELPHAAQQGSLDTVHVHQADKMGMP